MSTETEASRADNAISLYLSGKPLHQIKSETGVGPSLLHRIRQRRGVPTRPRRAPTDDQSIIRAYQAGSSENALARQYGVSRGAIANILADAGVSRRGMSEAGITRNENLTADQRRKQAAAANVASRQRKVPELDKLRRAIHNEWRIGPQSNGERYLWHALALHKPISQRAIGPYNVDLAMPPVAVEILGGRWHVTNPAHCQRTPYILDQGWHLILVWALDDGSRPLGPGAAEHIIAFTDRMRRNPPATCQYRVIDGDGQLLAARGREDSNFPVVPPPRGRLD